MHAFRYRRLVQPIALALVGSTALVAPGFAQARYVWGGDTGLWADSQNWWPSGVPTMADTVLLGDEGNYSIGLAGQAVNITRLSLFDTGDISNGTLGVGTIEVFTTNATFGPSLNVNMRPGAHIAFQDRTFALTIQGQLTSAEALLIQGRGTLVLDDGQINGSVLLQDATLQNGYDSNGTVTGNVDLQGDAILNAGGTMTIGSLSGVGGVILSGSAVGPTTPNQPTPVIGGALVVGTNNADTTFAGSLTGNGRFEKVGAGTLTLEGSTGSFTGTMNVTSGTLQLKDSPSNSFVTVDAAGTLSGSGTVKTLALSGTVSPHSPFALQSRLIASTSGNPIGELRISDRITFGAGSTYVVDVDADGNSDRLIGDSVLINGGTIRVRPVAGRYNPSTTYSIIETETSRTGEFTGAVVNDLAFLTPTLSYDDTNVMLRLDLNPDSTSGFATAATTGNQAAAAGGVESLGAGNPLYDAVLVQTNEGAQQAFSLLSGEPFASQAGMFQQTTTMLSNVVLSRANQSSNASTPEGSVMSYVDDGTSGHALSAGDRNVWASVYGSRATLDGNANAAAMTSGSGGLQVGADDWFGDFRLGLMVSAGRTVSMANNRNFSGNSDDYGIGVYGGTEIGATSIAVGALYQHHDVTSTRNVTFPGFSETLSGDYAAGTGQIFGEVAHRFDFGMVNVSPFAQLAYVNTSSNGFSETGGASALTVAARSDNAVFTTLGARLEGDFVLGNDMVVTANGALGWRHAFADAPVSTAAFTGGQSFSATGSPIASDAVVIEAGLKVDLATSVTLALNYGGQFASTANDHNASVKLAVQF